MHFLSFNPKKLLCGRSPEQTLKKKGEICWQIPLANPQGILENLPKPTHPPTQPKGPAKHHWCTGNASEGMTHLSRLRRLRRDRHRDRHGDRPPFPGARCGKNVSCVDGAGGVKNPTSPARLFFSMRFLETWFLDHSVWKYNNQKTYMTMTDIHWKMSWFFPLSTYRWHVATGWLENTTKAV